MTSTRKSKGFTIIELSFTIALLLLIGLGTISLIAFLLRGSSQQSGMLAGVDQARRVAFNIANELRRASYSDAGAFSIAQAGDQELIFYTNIDSDSQIERVRYYIQNSELYRGIVEPSGSPAVYNLASEEATRVLYDLGNQSVPLFYYYDDDYDGTSETPLAQPVNINNIRFVRINMLVVNVGGLTGTNTYPVSSGAVVRNLKTNLGE